MADLDLGLIVPCYLDAEHLAANSAEILAILDSCRWSYELIFVDDASPDNCGAVIDRFIAEHSGHRLRKLTHVQNTGRGRAVTDGFNASSARIVGFIDIDLEVHAHYLPAFILAVERGADVVTAERIYKLTPTLMHRSVLSRGYVWLVHALIGLPLPDTEAGYKFFNRARLMQILHEADDPGWFWDTEILAIAALRGLRIDTIPALFSRREDKKSTVKLARDTTDYLWKLWRFRRRLQAIRG